METGFLFLTVVAYGLTLFLWYRERTPNYVVALLAGHLGTLPSPLWQRLYHFSYDERFQPALFTALGYSLPRFVFVTGWLVMVPPLVVFWLYRQRWWFPGYLSGLITFALFLVYHLLAETVGIRNGWWRYTDAAVLPLGFSVTLLSALMNSLISLGLLSLLIVTRRYAWLSLLLLLLPMPLVLSLFVRGLLGAPLYTVLILSRVMEPQTWAGIIGILGTLGLVLWATHIVASSFDGLRNTARRAV